MYGICYMSSAQCHCPALNVNQHEQINLSHWTGDQATRIKIKPDEPSVLRLLPFY